VSRALGNTLPDILLERLSGRDLPARMGQAILITTTDAQGWPHLPCCPTARWWRWMRAACLATYRTSGTSGNMRRNGKLTLCFIDEGWPIT
jgi:hypothetical protein